MVRKANIVEYSELLSYANSIGISSHKAHAVLACDEVTPIFGSTMREYCISDHTRQEDRYEFSDITVRILVGFMLVENIDSFILVASI